MAYRMAPVLVTLNDLEVHSPVADLFKCNPSNICAVFCQISTDSALARSLSDSWASCFNYIARTPISDVEFLQCERGLSALTL